jgi:hypothetical protein
MNPTNVQLGSAIKEENAQPLLLFFKLSTTDILFVKAL